MRVRRFLALLTAVAVVATTAACTGDDSSQPPESGDITSPDAAAQTLADALASGDFGQVGFIAGEPADVTEEYAAVVEGLADLTPTVGLADVSEPSGDPATATATFDWTWPIGPDGWMYTTEATLVAGGRRVAGRVGRRHHRAVADARRSPSTWSRSAPAAATSWAPAGWRW